MFYFSHVYFTFFYKFEFKILINKNFKNQWVYITRRHHNRRMSLKSPTSWIGLSSLNLNGTMVIRRTRRTLSSTIAFYRVTLSGILIEWKDDGRFWFVSQRQLIRKTPIDYQEIIIIFNTLVYIQKREIKRNSRKISIKIVKSRTLVLSQNCPPFLYIFQQ